MTQNGYDIPIWFKFKFHIQNAIITINHDFAYIIAVIEAEYKSQLGTTKYISYLTLKDELWGVIRRDFGEN